jgi:hypothetical protein
LLYKLSINFNYKNSALILRHYFYNFFNLFPVDNSWNPIKTKIKDENVAINPDKNKGDSISINPHVNKNPLNPLNLI